MQLRAASGRAWLAGEVEYRLVKVEKRGDPRHDDDDDDATGGLLLFLLPAEDEDE
jgi:hypothetical protein